MSVIQSRLVRRLLNSRFGAVGSTPPVVETDHLWLATPSGGQMKHVGKDFCLLTPVLQCGHKLKCCHYRILVAIVFKLVVPWQVPVPCIASIGPGSTCQATSAHQCIYERVIKRLWSSCENPTLAACLSQSHDGGIEMVQVTSLVEMDLRFSRVPSKVFANECCSHSWVVHHELALKKCRTHWYSICRFVHPSAHSSIEFSIEIHYSIFLLLLS